MTLECGILDNESKSNRKRKLAERKSLHDGSGDVAELNAAVDTIAERTDFMRVSTAFFVPKLLSLGS